MNVRKALPVLLVIAVALLASPVLRADSVSIVFDQPTQSVVQGTLEVTFSATVTNLTAATVFLNGDEYSVSPAICLSSFLCLNDSAFLSNPNLISLSGNQIIDSVDLFTVTLPSDLATGTYAGSFSFTGGADSSALDNLGGSNFYIDVTSPVATPEPGTLAMLLLGFSLAGALSLLKLRSA
ncbi:MAG TPA: PEP-CTERM sorting domain-containing protein [Candidatus Acidoferrum sp.]|nr:PEP-CTERM sorting domain-containing protein [Candidatus Acidoferrum sp.]